MKKFCKCGCGRQVNENKDYIWGHNKSFLGKHHSEKIKKQIRKKNRKYSLNENYFKRIDSKEKAYFLGYITGDGNIHKIKRQLTITTTKDKEILLKFLKEIKGNQPIRKVQKNKKRYLDNYVWSLLISSSIITKDLSKYGVIPNKTFKTYFPQDLILKKYWRDYIRGLFDADGCICITKQKKFKWSIVGNFDLIKSIQKVLVKKCNINKRKLTRHRNNTTIYYIRYGGRNNCKKIYNYLYYPNCLCLERKLKIWEKII